MHADYRIWPSGVVTRLARARTVVAVKDEGQSAARVQRDDVRGACEDGLWARGAHASGMAEAAWYHRHSDAPTATRAGDMRARHAHVRETARRLADRARYRAAPQGGRHWRRARHLRRTASPRAPNHALTAGARSA